MSKFTKAVISDTTGTPATLTGNSLNVNITGGAAGGGPVTVADGSDVAEGATTDVAVVSDSNGTVSGKLRGLVKIFASVWDSVNGRLKVDASAVTVPVSNSGLTNLDVALSTRLKPADTLTGITTVGAVTSITNALPAGTNLLGKVGIDQTTPGTTNAVQFTNTSIQANAGTNLNTSLLALESGGNLATLVSRTPVVGQTTMASSSPVVIASNQSSIPVSATFPASSTIGITGLSDGDIVPFQRQVVVDHEGAMGVGGTHLEDISRSLQSIERILMAMHLVASQSCSGAYIDPNDVDEFLDQ